ncbi:uncharacterized protein BJ212DRAFT_598403 [Suillus subaureus]|uniref:Uncharacterized protein n=1 Tax=Suillus subaureus TaxID=48587 RepID=A0A9P7E2H5_9AGAM|nr:uncharacterized protein BJ212DRAFT_598403 [Suillus subaureus]KAG1809697.1 hypothetical protein BJ212DRAFT_598403 [Suillus subaureus]
MKYFFARSFSVDLSSLQTIKQPQAPALQPERPTSPTHNPPARDTHVTRVPCRIATFLRDPSSSLAFTRLFADTPSASIPIALNQL